MEIEKLIRCEKDYKCGLMDRIQEAILAISAGIDRAEKMAEEAEARGDDARGGRLRAEACALGSVLETISWCGIPIMHPLEGGDEGGGR